ncbi:hypothetical protein [Plantactinospora sonchi]|uniref:SWIM-type domain-containing protein n=1 Tax=Plantactinospora sonchi TaxID=1544735 RepID=A0ABU7RN53_9ACTN
MKTATASDPTGSAPAALPPVVPELVATTMTALPPRLHRRLDAAVARLGAAPRDGTPDGIRVDCGPEAQVLLVAGPGGVITAADQVRCSCLLTPRCLHRAAVLTACPVADAVVTAPSADGTDHAGSHTDQTAGGRRTTRADGAATASRSRARTGGGPSAAQRQAAAGLWHAASAVLAAGVPGAGAVLQAELLRAAHSARLAGLPRAESAALQVVRGLRAARDRRDDHRLADLVQVLHDLLLTAGRLAAGATEPGLVGISRRSYRPAGNLRVYGVCREPVISATGYAGVVTHLLDDDGRWYSVADVQPGEPQRALGVATAVVDLGPSGPSHDRLARGGLLVTGTTVSPEGRLGSGRGVRAIPVTGVSWSTGALGRLFARPLAEVVNAQLNAAEDGGSDTPAGGGQLVGADLVIVGGYGDHVLARELSPAPAQTGAESTSTATALLGAEDTSAADADPTAATARRGAEDTPPADADPAVVRRAATGPLIRLVPVSSHPMLAHLANLRRLASRPGLRIRVVARLDTERASTLRPLAVAPVPGAEVTLRLPEAWQGHADLGYDVLQNGHLPPPQAGVPDVPVGAAGPDPVVDAPLWRVRRLVESAVAGGRQAIAGPARSAGSGLAAPLRQSGFPMAAELAAALVAESDRRGRDAFGRLVDPEPERYAWAWVAAATHLAATERALIRASWSDETS